MAIERKPLMQRSLCLRAADTDTAFFSFSTLTTTKQHVSISTFVVVVRGTYRFIPVVPIRMDTCLPYQSEGQ